MLARSIPWGPPRWTLPETTYLSSDGFGIERFEVQRRSPGSQANEKPRQRRNSSMTRWWVRSSTRICCLGSPVRLRKGATATAVLGRRHDHWGGDLVNIRYGRTRCFGSNARYDIFYPSTVLSFL